MPLTNIERARFNMIEQQVRPWEVLDPRVLEVLAEVPREAFVPEAYRGLAFADIEIPLGHGQSMMKPVIEGRLLQALDIQPAEKILEIGTGSGFITACLARLGEHVTSLEIHDDLRQKAQARLAAQGIENVSLFTTDALAQAAAGGPFNIIAVTGSLPDPNSVEAFKHQLKPGGRMFVVVGEKPIMEAWRITRVGENEWRSEGLFETELAPLVNAPLPQRFRF